MTGEGIRASGRPPGQLAKRWLGVLASVEERLKGRIRRGRTLARSGRVLSLEIAPGTVYAEVEDAGDLHRPTIRVRTYEDGEWRRVLETLGGRLDLLAALLEGDVDAAFLEELDRHEVTLFPGADELDGDCDCVDYAVPCAHGAAVHHLLAEAVEGEPLLLFALRGRPREQLLAEIRRRWGDTSIAPGTSSVPDEPPPPGDWFASPTPIGPMSFRVHRGSGPSGLLELGPLGGDGDLVKTLEPLYEAGAEAARELALGQPLRANESHEGGARWGAAGLAGESDSPRPSVAQRQLLGTPPPAGPRQRAPATPVPPPPPSEEPDLGERLVDLLAEAEDGATSRELAEQLGIDSVAVRRELLELEDLGVVARTGSTRATRWWLG